MADSKPHVIVGAGLAGAKAAEALREEGFEGQIVLVGQEPELPYERPPLSKDYLRGESPREKARVHPEEFYAANEVDLRTATAVERIDTQASAVVLSTGGDSPTTGCSLPPVPSRVGCRSPGQTSTVSITCATSWMPIGSPRS